MVGWEYPTNPREASGLDPEAVHDALQDLNRYRDFLMDVRTYLDEQGVLD